LLLGSKGIYPENGSRIVFVSEIADLLKLILVVRHPFARKTFLDNQAQHPQDDGADKNYEPLIPFQKFSRVCRVKPLI
jgi:hypothetical protein